MQSILEKPTYYNAEKIASMIEGSRRSGSGWVAFCPAHDDQHRSLSIGEGEDGRTLLNCFAGCTIEEITNALGISVSDLFPNEYQREEKELVATYQYTDEQGELLFEVLRYRTADGSKEFRQRRPDGQGGWIWNTRGVRKVLYQLKYIQEAIKDGEAIIIVEGEKDADRLFIESNGNWIATTAPGGASAKWLPEYTEQLRGAKEVIIIPDNDEPGRKHAEKVAAALYGAVGAIYIVSLPGLPDKGDVSDWLDAGHTIKDLHEAIKEYAKPWEPINDVVKPIEVKTQVVTDQFFEGKTFKPVRLAQAILEENAFFYDGTKLFAYDGGVYKPDGERIAGHIAIRLLGDRYREHYVRETIAYIKRATWPGKEAINVDDDLINVKNGLLNWRTGELYPHDPRRLSTIQIPVYYDPDAKCERINQFFREVLPEDAIPTIEELFGYLMRPTTEFEKAFMFTGTGANGKSTMINLITAFIGQDNISNVALQDLENNRFKLAQLYGKLANIFADLSPKALESSAVFKAVVSGDSLSAEFKGVDSFDFRPFARLIFSANEIPASRDVGEAFFRRWIIIPFPNRFEHGKNANKNLIHELTTEKELSGLLNLAIEGLRRLEAQGCFTENETTRQALETYKKETDNVASFIDEMCFVDDNAEVYTTELYEAYRYWCERCGYKALSKKRFHAQLKTKIPGLDKGRRYREPEHYKGIGLLTAQTYF